MATIENIRQRACVVRDEEAEQQNTASRVGGLLVDMACALSESIPWGRVSATAYAAEVRIEYDTVSATGAVTRRSIDLPAASTSNAGVMTAAQAQQLAAHEAAFPNINTYISGHETAIAGINTSLAGLSNQVVGSEQELLLRLQGRSAESDASTDPFVWLGDFAPEEGEAENYTARINAALDALCTLEGGADNRRWCGRIAGTAYGNRFEAVQMAVSYAAGRYVQVCAGCVGVAGGGASLSFGRSEYAVFWRPVEGGVPGTWRRYGGEAQGDVAAGAADGRFVYSSGENNKAVLSTVMSAGGTSLIQSSGKLVFRAHWWNPRGTAGMYFSTAVPCATTGSDGAMPKEVFSRLGSGASIYEGTPTLDSVPVVYPNWADGSARNFTLGAATSARAGVMTAAQAQQLAGYEQRIAGNELAISSITAGGLSVAGDQYSLSLSWAPQNYAAQAPVALPVHGLDTDAASFAPADTPALVTPEDYFTAIRPVATGERMLPAGAQEDVAAVAADGRFVYSSGVNDKAVLSTVMSAGGTGLLQSSGKLVFRAHWWNPKGTAGKFFSTEVPCATKLSDGAMSKQDKERVDALWLRPKPLVVEACVGCEADLMELHLETCSDRQLADALGVDDGVSAYEQLTEPLLSGRPLLLRSSSEKAAYFSAWQASPLVCSLTVAESDGADPAQYTYRLRIAFTGTDGTVRRLQCRLSYESVVRETWS